MEKFFEAADRDRLDPILDAGVATYREELDEDGQMDFKGKAKGFLRTYGFLSAILPYNNAEWEKLSIFLPLLAGPFGFPHVIASAAWQSRRRSNDGSPARAQPQRDCHFAALLAMTTE